MPKLYAQDSKGDSAIAYVKYFTPRSNWTWYGTEYDPIERMFFGLVIGFEPELGYFSLDELEEMARKGKVERDLYFDPTTIGQLREQYER